MAQHNESNKLFKKCEESNNPLVPSLIPGQDELCSLSMLEVQSKKLDEVQDDFRVEEKIEIDELSQPNDNKCKKCTKSNNPLVPSLYNIPDQDEHKDEHKDELCPRCMLETQIKKLDEVQDFRVEEIGKESGQLSEQLEGRPPNKTTLDLKEVKQKARGAIKLMMRLHVPKKGSEEVGKFEATYGDVQVMEALAPDVCLRLRKGSLRQFHSILHPEDENNLEGTLFEVFDSNERNKSEYRDQNKRAKRLVEEMNNSKKVFLLDGHGRMLLSIIHAMIEQDFKDLDSVEFVVVDNNKECHRFHEHFFPKSSVTCECMDILDIKPGPTDMIYMNFCSIPPRSVNYFFNKEEVLKWLWERMNTMKCGIMISAMIRDARTKHMKQSNLSTAFGPQKGEKHLIPAGFKQLLEDKAFFGADHVSHRHNFWTWFILPQKCTVKHKPNSLEESFKSRNIIWDRTDDSEVERLAQVYKTGVKARRKQIR